MKKVASILTLAVLISLQSFADVANNNVKLAVERSYGAVLVHVQSENLNDLDKVVVERSGDNLQSFAAFKTIDVASINTEGNYIGSADRNPLPVAQGSFYRITTISKDGTSKTYEPVELAASN